jgi:hypothetical protein
MSECEHDYKEVERFYASPAAAQVSGEGSSDDTDGTMKTLERLSFGVTTILYRCSKCDEMMTKEILGRSQGKSADTAAPQATT